MGSQLTVQLEVPLGAIDMVVGPTRLKSAVLVLMTLEMVSVIEPVFWIVMVCGADVAPTLVSGNVSAPPTVGGVAGAGAVSAISGSTPVPVTVMSTDGVLTSLDATLMVPVSGPVAVGRNDTVTVTAVAPGASVPLQPGAEHAIEKFGEASVTLYVRAEVVAPVGLLIVNVRVVALVVLMRWLPKSASGGPAIWRSGVLPVQVSATVRGDIGSSLTMLSVPVLAPIVVGSQRSVMLSVLPGPGAAAIALSGPQLWPVVHPENANVKFVVGSLVIVIDAMFSAMPPVLVRTRFWVTPPDAAMSTVPNARLAAADRLEMAPVPEMLMTLVASARSGSLVVSVTMPVRAPTALGTKPTWICALPPAATVPDKQATPPPGHDSGNSVIDEVAAL